MGSKPWHKLTALGALSFLVMVGCNSGAQKNNDVAAKKSPPASTQTAQTAPYGNLPPMQQPPFPTVPAQANGQIMPASGTGFPSGPMSPPPNGINNGPVNNTGFTPSPIGPSSPNFPPPARPTSANFPPPPGSANPGPPLGGLPTYQPINPGPNPPPMPGSGTFAIDPRPAPITINP